MSDKRNRGGELGDDRQFRGTDGNQEARDRGETGRYEDEATTESGAYGAGGGGREVPGRDDTSNRVKRHVHQEGEEPLPYDHDEAEWLGTPAEPQSPYVDESDEEGQQR